MSPTEKEHSSRFDAMAEAFDLVEKNHPPTGAKGPRRK